MRILFLSDIHYYLPGKLFHGVDESVAFSWLEKIVISEKPDLIFSAGDWGIPATPEMFQPILARAPLYTTYGNHDSTTTLNAIRNADGSPCLLENGHVLTIDSTLRVGGIGGNFGSGRKWHHVAREHFVGISERLAAQGVDIFITHEPLELYAADRGRKFGWREVTEAVKMVKPKLHLCGHFHCDSILAELNGIPILKLDSSQTRKQYAVACYRGSKFEELELRERSGSRKKVLANLEGAVDVEELLTSAMQKRLEIISPK